MSVYSLSVSPLSLSLMSYFLGQQCLHPTGAVYVAGKKHYFGVGGGTRQFIRVVDDDGKSKGIDFSTGVNELTGLRRCYGGVHGR